MRPSLCWACANGRCRGRNIHEGHGLARWVGRCCHLSCHSSRSNVAAAASARTQPTAVTNAPRWATWAPSVRPSSYIQKGFPVNFGRVRSLLSAELYICQQFSQHVATFNQRVSRGTCSAGAVGCGLLRTEHVKNKTQQSDRGLKHLCVQKRRDEARRRPSSWIEEFRALFLVETPFYLISLFFPSP